MLNSRIIKQALAITVVFSLYGCTIQETSRIVPLQKGTMASIPYTGKRIPITIGHFQNKSAFLNGIFSNGSDRLGNQAKTILMAHLKLSNRFNVLDRDNMEALSQEASLQKRKQNLKGAAYLITGHVTEFGRKEVGDHQLFGILGRGKSQVAYAKVTLNIVNTSTSEVVHSSQGASEYALSNREIIGFGSTSSYDSTLNGKVLDLAIREAVDNLAKATDSGAFN